MGGITLRTQKEGDKWVEYNDSRRIVHGDLSSLTGINNNCYQLVYRRVETRANAQDAQSSFVRIENQNGDTPQEKVNAYRGRVSSTATDLTITRAGRLAAPRSKKGKEWGRLKSGLNAVSFFKRGTKTRISSDSPIKSPKNSILTKDETDVLQLAITSDENYNTYKGQIPAIIEKLCSSNNADDPKFLEDIAAHLEKKLLNDQGKIQKGKHWKIARQILGVVEDNGTPIHEYGPNMMRLCATFLMGKDSDTGAFSTREVIKVRNPSTKTRFMTALQQKFTTPITVSSEDATFDQTKAQVSFLEALLTEGDEPLLSDLMRLHAVFSALKQYLPDQMVAP